MTDPTAPRTPPPPTPPAPPTAHRGRSTRRLRRDGGAATVEVVGYLALVLTLLLLGVQLVLWAAADYSARLVADRAAQTARVYGATADAGALVAADHLASTLGRTLRDTEVTVSRTATTVTVRVTGHAHTILPGTDPAVSVIVSLPVERAT